MTDNESIKKPKTLAVARAIGWVTFIEVISDKILYNSGVGCAILLAIGVLSARLSFVHPERIVLDFGLSGVNLSCSAIAILLGSSLIVREFERRTIYVALCHPISRFQFILGKFFGIGMVLVANWLIFSAGYLTILAGSAGLELSTSLFNSTLAVALGLILIQTLILSSIAILFSSVSTTSLSVMITVGFYLIGNNISQIRFVAQTAGSNWVKTLLNGVAVILPNLEYFNLGTKVTYGLPLPSGYVFESIVYGALVITFLLMLGGLLIQNREV